MEYVRDGHRARSCCLDIHTSTPPRVRGELLIPTGITKVQTISASLEHVINYFEEYIFLSQIVSFSGRQEKGALTTPGGASGP